MFRITYYVTERMHIFWSVLYAKHIRPPPAHPFQVIFTMSKSIKNRNLAGIAPTVLRRPGYRPDSYACQTL